MGLDSTYGVQEYWIINWQQQTLMIYRCSGTQRQLEDTLGSQAILTSPLLPGFSTPLAELFS